MRIRSASTADIEPIIDVRAIVHADYYPNTELGITEADVLATDVQDILDDRRNLFRQITDVGTSKVDVLSNLGNVVGYCVSRKRDITNTIDYIHILPEAQGSGHGRELASRAIEWLRDDKPIWIEVVAHNSEGRRFWESLGFVATRDEAKTPTVMASGIVLPHIEMTRPA